MEHQTRLEDGKFSSNKEKFLLPSSYVGAKMKKGIFKGLRYFSNILDPKEPEMQIGYPTNVRHVAHIGWDSPSENTPSWMSGFRSAPLMATVNEDPAETPKFPSSEFILTGELPKRLVPITPKQTEKSEKPPRRKKSAEELAPSSNSPKRESPSSKHCRSRQSRSPGSCRDSTDVSSRSLQELAAETKVVAGKREAQEIPKKPCRRRTKGSSSNSGGEGGSAQKQRSSRADGKEEERIQEDIGSFLPAPKPAKEVKEELLGNFLISMPSPALTSLCVGYEIHMD